MSRLVTPRQPLSVQATTRIRPRPTAFFTFHHPTRRCDDTRFGVIFHQYADYTQIYLAANKVSLLKATLDLASCTDAVYEWLLHKTLALNPDKSEVEMFGTTQRVGKLKQSALIAIAGAQIVLTDYVKSLGVTFDSHLSFDKHVNNICYACYFHIHGL